MRPKRSLTAIGRQAIILLGLGGIGLSLGCASPERARAGQDITVIPSCIGGVRFGMTTHELEAARPKAEGAGETWSQYYETGLECRVFERADYTFDRLLLFWGEERLSRVRLVRRFAAYGDLLPRRDPFLSSLASAWGTAPERFVRTQGLPEPRHHLPVLTWRIAGATVEAIYTPSRDIDGLPFEEDSDPMVKHALFYFELQITSDRYWGIPFFFKPRSAAGLSGSDILFRDFDDIAGGDPLPPGEWMF